MSLRRALLAATVLALPMAAQAQPVTGLTATPSGLGYWIVTSAGAVTAFGDARAFG